MPPALPPAENTSPLLKVTEAPPVRSDGCYFLAMEYLPGENLRSLARAVKLRQEHIPSEIAATIIAAAAAGLHYAHSLTDEKGQPLGIVHRDVSPANLMVTHRGAVKVLDFGIARAEGKLAETQTGVIKGKWAYMAPEQIRSQPLDPRTDVFALGVVLYEMLTGARLFQRDNELATVSAVMTDPIPPPRQVRPTMPPEIEAVVMKALERDPARRFQNAEELQRALNEFIAHRTFVNPSEGLQRYLLHIFGEQHLAELKQLPSTDPAALIEALDKTEADPRPSRPEPLRPEGVPLGGGDEAPTRYDKKTAPPALPLGKLALGAAAAAALLGIGAGLFALRPQPPSPPPELPAQEAKVAVAPSPSPPTVQAPPEAPGPVAEPVKVAVAAPLPAEPEVAPPKPRRPRAAAPKQFGTLQVNCVPWCRVYIDGADTGKNSPVSDLKLAVGKHKLKVVNPPSGAEREREIEIAADAVKREVVRF